MHVISHLNLATNNILAPHCGLLLNHGVLLMAVLHLDMLLH